MSQRPSIRGSLNLGEVPHSLSCIFSSLAEAVTVGVLVCRTERVGVEQLLGLCPQIGGT